MKFIMVWALFVGGIISIVFLIGCAAPPPSEPMPRGAEVMPPAGWIDYCRRTPDDCDWTRP